MGSTKTREAADYLEGALIMHFEYTCTNISWNYNYTTLKDYGGEQPLGEDDAHEHFVYIAVKPLAPPKGTVLNPASHYYGDQMYLLEPTTLTKELGDTPEDSEDDLPLEMEF